MMNTYKEVQDYEINKNKKFILLFTLLLFVIIIASSIKIYIYDDKDIVIKDNEIYATCINNCTHLFTSNKILINGRIHHFKGIWLDKNTCKIVLEDNQEKNIKEAKLYKGSISTLKSFLNILRTKGET